MHLGGKIELRSKEKITNRDQMSRAYTPGVAKVSEKIKKDKSSVWALTSKSHSVAIVTDGSAVLGLGDIGPEAALPVMEGKAVILKEFGGVDQKPDVEEMTDPEKKKDVEITDPEEFGKDFIEFPQEPSRIW